MLDHLEGTRVTLGMTGRAAREFAVDPRPDLSWKVTTPVRDWRQSSATLRATLNGATAMATVQSDLQSADWPFRDLNPRDQVVVEVRVIGSDGERSAWSDPLIIRAGFLGPGEWTGSFIGADDDRAPGDRPVTLRKTFTLTAPVHRGLAYATARGTYQIFVNGTAIDDHVLKPGWTAYQFRLEHETTDITALLRAGENTIEIVLAGGWFTERYADMGPGRPFYGTRTSVAAVIVVESDDNRIDTIMTDPSWFVSDSGPLRSSGIYAGEHVDARRSIDEDAWRPVRADPPDLFPVPRIGPPVRRVDELPVKEVMMSPSGKLILDFGQNLVGRLRIVVAGERGRQITLRHAEVLQDGELARRPLRLAEATDSYIIAGGGTETWEPSFTFHGFRYAEVDNWPGEFDPASVVAVVVHSDMERTGWFESSEPLINQLHSNVVWGLRGNTLSLPTDCPQRDERWGWTGDIQAFSPTAAMLYECSGFLTSWLTDLRLEQAANDGIVPFIVPDVIGGGGSPIAGWGDASTFVPWALYESYGSIAVLRDQYASMCGWLRVIEHAAGPGMLWESGFQFGDWLDPDAPADDPGKAKTDPGIVATAFLFRSARIVADASVALGRDGRWADAIADRARTAFLDTYVTSSGRMVSDAPTAYSLAIVFGIVEEPRLRQALGDRLAHLVRASAYHIGTGFIGTPLIQDALTQTGHFNAAVLLLTQTECPSWLYPVTMGATTIWERWDSLLEDGSVNPGEMTSFNHYALGSVASWLHSVVAGLTAAAPGHREILIAPHPIASWTFASTAHETPYGRAESSWRREGDHIVVAATIPPGTMAHVHLPGASNAFDVGSGRYSWTVATLAAPAPVRLSGSSTLAEIADDREAYETVMAAISATDQHAATSFRRRTKWVTSRVLIDDFTELPPPAKAAAKLAVENLQRRRDSASFSE